MRVLMLATITSAETQMGWIQFGATPPIHSIDGSYVMFLCALTQVESQTTSVAISLTCQAPCLPGGPGGPASAVVGGAPGAGGGKP